MTITAALAYNLIELGVAEIDGVEYVLVTTEHDRHTDAVDLYDYEMDVVEGTEWSRWCADVRWADKATLARILADLEINAVTSEIHGMVKAAKRPTFDQVTALRYEAIDAGDLELAAACHMAIEDDNDAAWGAVMAALDYAAGQI
jgi:hypothetical protein